MKKTMSIFVLLSMVIMFTFSPYVYAAQIDGGLLVEVDYSVVKSMLLDLGMKPYFVERMSNDQLERIANSQGISCVTQQIPIVDLAEGDVAIPTAGPLIPITPVDPDEPEPRETYSNYRIDDYMTLFLLVIKLNDYNYLVSADADWLTMPQNYLTDCLGIVASKLAVVDSTRSGWFDYRLRYNNGSETLFSHNFSSENFTTYRGESSWAGAVATFDLFDIIDENRSSNNSIINMYAHYEFEMTSGAEIELGAINVAATYDHMVVYFTFENSISVGTDGIGFSITPQTVNKFHRRTVALEEPINYTPA